MQRALPLTDGERLQRLGQRHALLGFLQIHQRHLARMSSEKANRRMGPEAVSRARTDPPAYADAPLKHARLDTVPPNGKDFRVIG